MTTWRPASNGATKRRWVVYRWDDGAFHEASNGRVIRYASLETAQRVADRLNEAAAEAAWERGNLVDIDLVRYAE